MFHLEKKSRLVDLAVCNCASIRFYLKKKKKVYAPRAKGL